MPFRHPEPADPLAARIDAEVRQRLEDAVDYACLERMVAARRARGLPPPARDNTDDRREFERGVRAFLERLERELAPEPAARAGPADGDAGRLLERQVRLARSLPDYWQRFDAIRTAWSADGRGESEGGVAPFA